MKFDPGIAIIRGTVAEHLYKDALSHLLTYEVKHGLRLRARREKDEAVLHKTMGEVVANLLCAYLQDPQKASRGGGGWVSISLSTEYQSKTLPMLLSVLSFSGLDLIELHIAKPSGPKKQDKSRMRAGAKLRELVRQYSPTMEDLIIPTAPSAPVIELRGEKPVKVDKKGRKKKGRAKRLPFQEDNYTTNATRQMHFINAEMEDHALEFEGTVECDGKDVEPDMTLKHMVRIYNLSFEGGGFPYGGVWQTFSQEERLDGRMSIDGDNELIELDFAQNSARILYSMIGQTPPAGDCYLIPGFERHREEIKTMFNAMVGEAPKRVQRFPNGLSGRFPHGTSCKQVVAAIEAHHQPIAHLFYEEHSVKLQLRIFRRGSDVMCDATERLKAKKVAALMNGDAVDVREIHRDIAWATIRAAFRSYTGQPGGQPEPVLTVERYNQMRDEMERLPLPAFGGDYRDRWEKRLDPGMQVNFWSAFPHLVQQYPWDGATSMEELQDLTNWMVKIDEHFNPPAHLW